jgi:hypothetical protein
MVEDFVSMNLNRQPVVVETVHEIVATYHGLGQLLRT